MLKLVTLKKMKEDYPDIKMRMELPGGLDVNRVTLPIILNAPKTETNTPTQTPAISKQTKSKVSGILGLFKSTSNSPEVQRPNNLEGNSTHYAHKNCF